MFATRFRLGMMIAGALLSATAARAGLTSVNINSTGGGFTSGASETDWTVTSPASVTTTPFVTEGTPTTLPFNTWGADSLPTYGWISPHQAYSGGQTDAPGTWDFTTTFSLAGDIPSTADIAFKVAVDNTLPNSVTLNGNVVTIAGLSGAGFDLSTTIFTLPTADLVAGTNTLTFVVTNGTGNAGNPVGLLVDFTTETVDTASPEPSTALLLVGGLVAIIARARRKR